MLSATRQKITLWNPELCVCSWGVGHYVQKSWGNDSWRHSIQGYVMRPGPQSAHDIRTLPANCQCKYLGGMLLYAVELLSCPSLAFWGLLSGPSLFFLHCLSKHYKNRGFSTSVWKDIVRKQFRGYYLVQVCVFLKRTQLGPDNNPYLDEIITPRNVFFFVIVCF